MMNFLVTTSNVTFMHSFRLYVSVIFFSQICRRRVVTDRYLQTVYDLVFFSKFATFIAYTGKGEIVVARTQLEVDRHIVQNMYRRRNEQLIEAKTTYFTNKVEESKDDPKALFRLTRNMMRNSGDNILPVDTSTTKY